MDSLFPDSSLTESVGTHGEIPKTSPHSHADYLSSASENTLTAVVASVQGRSGLTVLTGEAGTGKTRLIHRVLNRLDEAIRPVLVPDPRFDLEEFISFAHEQIGFDDPQAIHSAVPDKLEAFRSFLSAQIREGHSVTFFIDDAQNLRDEVLADLLSLCRAQITGQPLLQIVLIGLPELEARLRNPQFYALAGESLPGYRLMPLNADEVGHFIAEQLSASGNEAGMLFTPQAIASIALHSRGIPRLISVLCDFTMFTAKLHKQHRVTADIVEAAATELSTLTLAAAEETSRGESEVPGRDEITPEKREAEELEVSLSAPADQGAAGRPDAPAHEQEKPMQRSESLRELLQNLQSDSPDIEASALITGDGQMIACLLPQNINETQLAAMSATLVAAGTRAATELKRGELEEIIIRGEHGYAVMMSVDGNRSLLVLSNREAGLGLILFPMRRVADAIRLIR
jgi:type II secretory pathway predicted ATPase ExeA/predicted regulator of Ras-like GTPase activity (Roadblock/LC7/MglB family)